MSKQESHPTPPSREAAAYLKAAEIIARGGNKCDYGYDGACDVLHCPDYADCTNETWRRRLAFQDLFVDGEDFYLVTEVLPTREAQRWRVLALCFMAAIVEEEAHA